MNSKNIITKNYILSKLIEKSHPSSNGLYPHEILVLLYAPRFFLWDNYFQCFWEEYYVTDVQSILDSLMKRGFIEIGDLASILETRTCKELKEELKSQKIKSTGKKNELIDRLLSYGDIQKLDKKFSRKKTSIYSSYSTSHLLSLSCRYRVLLRRTRAGIIIKRRGLQNLSDGAGRAADFLDRKIWFPQKYRSFRKKGRKKRPHTLCGLLKRLCSLLFKEIRDLDRLLLHLAGRSPRCIQ